ncbi:hypothetical protein BDW68DRAFT_168564 [Aspergillus falconensis]
MGPRGPSVAFTSGTVFWTGFSSADPPGVSDQIYQQRSANKLYLVGEQLGSDPDPAPHPVRLLVSSAVAIVPSSPRRILGVLDRSEMRWQQLIYRSAYKSNQQRANHGSLCGNGTAVGRGV